MANSHNSGLTGSRDSDHAWSDYWNDEDESDQALSEGSHAASLRDYWTDVFRTSFLDRTRPMRLLDAACGSGVVARTAYQIAETMNFSGLDVFLSDYSAPALMTARQKPGLASAKSAAADARSLPFVPGSMDLVVSQFGLEYAGLEGFESAINLVALEGRMACVIHKSGGAIAEECSGNLEVLTSVASSGLIESFIKLFTAIRETAAENEVRACAEVASDCSQRVTATLVSAPAGAAKDHVAQLLLDMQMVMDRIGNYSVADIHDWAQTQSTNLEAYRIRMDSMVASAQNESGIRAITDLLTQQGFAAIEVGEFPVGEGAAPMAWTLDARRAKA